MSGAERAKRFDPVGFRRDLHRHPEPAWCEFYTTARIVEAVREIGVDAVHVGPAAIDSAERDGVPDEAALEQWRDRALDAGADPALLETMAGGHTGAVAVLERGDGPGIGLRVDIDALPRPESTAEDHVPVAEGFRPPHDDAMHACGHDAHAAIGIGVLETIARDEDFEGTLRVFFQPAEEVIGGGRAMAATAHLAEVEYLLSLHVGLDHPTGRIVGGIDEFYAVQQFEAEFTGTPTHAGARPQDGENAIQALAAAIEGLYGIPRHGDGATRVNVGRIEGGSAVNIVAESARMDLEVRGETTGLMEYMARKARRRLESAARMHDCEVDLESVARAPGAESDDALAAVVGEVAAEVEGVTEILDSAALGASEDATYLMNRVQEGGGLACYVGVGTDHPGGHHTATFDVDEASIPIGIEVLAGTIREIARNGV